MTDYPDDVMKDICIIDMCELLYWTAHERMTQVEWEKMLDDKKAAVERLHEKGYTDPQIRQIWVEKIKPFYDTSTSKVKEDKQ